MSTLAEGQNYALGDCRDRDGLPGGVLAGLEPDGKTPIFKDLRPDKRVSENGFDGTFKGEFPSWELSRPEYVGMETKTLALTSLHHVNRIAHNGGRIPAGALQAGQGRSPREE